MARREWVTPGGMQVAGMLLLGISPSAGTQLLFFFFFSFASKWRGTGSSRVTRGFPAGDSWWGWDLLSSAGTGDSPTGTRGQLGVQDPHPSSLVEQDGRDSVAWSYSTRVLPWPSLHCSRWLRPIRWGVLTPNPVGCGEGGSGTPRYPQPAPIGAVGGAAVQMELLHQCCPPRSADT